MNDSRIPTMSTERQARRRLYWYFRETLRVLPEELSLSVAHPELPRATFRAGITMPYGDDDEHRPNYFDICYWVLGSAADLSDHHFDGIVHIWCNLGWPIRINRTARPRTTSTRSPDGYGFAVTQSRTGYLSLSGSTPPFLPDRVALPFPRMIEHP